jgi:hypothetical protein
MAQRLPIWLAALTVATLAAPAALAQGSRPERPYRGLFASGLGRTEQSLVANGSIGGGWDNNVVADVLFGERRRSSNLNTASRGGVGTASGSLNYGLDLGTVSANASAGTSVHYYPTLASHYVRRYFVSAGTSVQVTRDGPTVFGMRRRLERRIRRSLKVDSGRLEGDARSRGAKPPGRHSFPH